jgi:hypothetical protein
MLIKKKPTKLSPNIFLLFYIFFIVNSNSTRGHCYKLHLLNII